MLLGLGRLCLNKKKWFCGRGPHNSKQQFKACNSALNMKKNKKRWRQLCPARADLLFGLLLLSVPVRIFAECLEEF